MTAIELWCQVLFDAGFFRFLGLAVVFPFPEGVLHAGTKIGLALALSLSGIEDFGEAPLTMCSAVDIVIEFVFGMLLGSPLLVLYSGLRMWGDLFESLRGHQIGLVIDPLSGGDEPAFVALLSQIVLIGLLVRTTLPEIILLEMHSGANLSPGELSRAILFSNAQALFKQISGILQGLICLLLPYLLIVLCIELTMALVSRVAGGISLGAEAYLVRLVALTLFMWFEADTLTTAFQALLTQTI